MKNLSIQEGPGWGYVHLFTNVFREERIKQFLFDDRYEYCESILKINKLLQDIGYVTFRMGKITTCPPNYPPLPINYVIDVISHDNDTTKYPEWDYPMVPYFLTVQTEELNWRAVAVLKINDKYLYIDSKFKNIIKLESPTRLIRYFRVCGGIERVIAVLPEVDDKVGWLILNAEEYGFTDLL